MSITIEGLLELLGDVMCQEGVTPDDVRYITAPGGYKGTWDEFRAVANAQSDDESDWMTELTFVGDDWLIVTFQNWSWQLIAIPPRDGDKSLAQFVEDHKNRPPYWMRSNG